MADLSTKARNRLPDSSFAVPSERKFPIENRGHAANAEARAQGTKYEAQVNAAVHRKYPDMGKSNSGPGNAHPSHRPPKR